MENNEQDIKFIDKYCVNYVKKFAFLPVLIQINDNMWKYVWFKPYYERYIYTKFNSVKMDMFGNIRVVEEVEWNHTNNVDYIKS